MTDTARAEITNAIWLCGNCHKKIDSDELLYPSDVLFTWRELHERQILKEIGTKTEIIRSEKLEEHLGQFAEYPPIIRRIAADQPDGWEWRLTAELMRHLNAPVFRQMADLRDNLYYKSKENVGDDGIIDWIQNNLSEAEKIVEPFDGLITRLSKSWGPHGQPGDIDEIHHMCRLIRDHLQQVVAFEEKFYFCVVPAAFDEPVKLLQGLISTPSQKLKKIPDDLDKIVAMIGTDHGGTEESPHVVRQVIDFDLPENWSRQFERAYEKSLRSHSTSDQKESPGCFTFLLLVILAWWVFSYLF